MRLPRPVILPLVLCLVFPGVPSTASAQQSDSAAAKKAERRRLAAKNAPLFASQEPLAVTLRTDIKLLRKKLPDKNEVDGTLTFPGPGGSPATVPVKVRTRGNFRRLKANCNFPPLRLNFAGKTVKGTVFEGQDKLKLVTPCQDSKDDYQQYVLQEYLAYKVYQLLTPVSFRVRLLHITYEDVHGAYDTRTKTAFLIENDAAMAARNDGEIWDWKRFSSESSDSDRAAVRVLASTVPEPAVMASLFEFMIGNTDISMPYLHNAVLVGRKDGRAVWVPYDFDWSGVVDARYARPDARLPIRNVRDRLYRGFCRPGVDFNAVADRFKQIRDSIPPLYQGLQGLEPKQRDRVLKYYDDFYKVLNDPKKFQREVIQACRPVG